MYGIATIKPKDRGIGFNFKFKASEQIDIVKLKEFKFEIGADKYEGQILLSMGTTPKLGELVSVFV